MFRKSYLFFVLIVATMAAGSLTAFGQNAPTSGRVERADTKEPVVGAVIEVFRVDIKAGSPATKTNKKGEFIFAGFTLGATYVLSVSAPNCAPTYYPNVKAGQERLLITLDAGDGHKYTEEEVRTAVKGGGKSNSTGSTGAAGKDAGGQVGELTDEGKKKKAEYDAQVAAVEAKNKKAVNTNEVVGKSLKEGNAAFDAKNFDLAIAKYDEGIAADPDFVGTAPILLNNRGSVLRDRAIDLYNKNAKSTDATTKIEAFGKVKKDFAMSAESYNRAWTISKNAPAAEVADPKTNEASQAVSIRGARETFRVSVLTEQVDPSVIEAAKILIPEYLKLEPDAAKKSETMVLFADLYRVGFLQEDAVVIYKNVLETSPENLDALNGAGLCLVNLGFIDIENAKTPVNKVLADQGKARLQEGANYLQKFASLAPDTNKFKADAIGLIDTLKKEQNVTAAKPSGGGKKKP